MDASDDHMTKTEHHTLVNNNEVTHYHHSSPCAHHHHTSAIHEGPPPTSGHPTPSIVSPGSIHLGARTATLLAPAHFSANTPSEGYYVIMTPGRQESFLTHATSRKISSPTSPPSSPADLSLTGNRNVRDERRRATHNEVERRRRDKINNWISKLSRIVPDCSQEHTKQGQSKGGILAKTYDHIVELEQQINHLREAVKDRDVLVNEVVSLRQQLNDARNENHRLRDLIDHRQEQEVIRTDRDDIMENNSNSQSN